MKQKVFFSIGEERLSEEETFYEAFDTGSQSEEKVFKSFSEHKSEHKGLVEDQHFVISKYFENYSNTWLDSQSPLEHYKRSSLVGIDGNHKEKVGVKFQSNSCFAQCLQSKELKHPKSTKKNSLCTLI